VTIPLLNVDNLSIGYRTGSGMHTAVQRVSFRLERERSLGLVGESGCGKTTIGMALMGLLPPSAQVLSGSVLFEGEDLISASDARMREIRWSEISMIFQAAMNALNPVHRVQDQIAEAIITHEPSLSSHAVAHRTRALFELVKIPQSRLKDYPHQFSGGMRQRVIIAMALACNPSLIIADEPTTALDVIVQDQILKSIATFQKETKIGMIFISHDIAVVADVCTDIGVMYGGSLVELGRTEDVFHCPAHPYTRLLVGSLLTLSDEPADLSRVSCEIDPTATGESFVGCPFNELCADAFPACKKGEAGWIELSKSHWVRCLLARKGGGE
jgi:peptide/nickel transport system ATP-binding protein